jgi:8-oxo-dGTP pyrophosphatase MutT (NUDIX family)
MKKIKYTEEDIFDHDGVTAVIKNDNEEILMQEHIKYGFWTTPVGKVKKGQSIEEGLREEMSEECNIIIEESKEVKTKRYTYKRNGKKVKVRVHVFEILKYKGTLKNNEPHKHTQQKFISLDEIKKLPYLSDVTILYLRVIGFERKAHI